MTNHPNRGKVRNWRAYLQEFRGKHDLTVEQLADLLAISARTVSSWEYEERVPMPYLKRALRDAERELGERRGTATTSHRPLT